VAASVEKSIFGRMPDGTEIEQYTLTNANGLSCKIITYGGTMTELRAPDRNGQFANIVLGYAKLEEYLAGEDYRGAIIGRVANRIAGASFTLDGKTCKLPANDGTNHLHGGLRGFDKRIWKAHWIAGTGAAVALNYTSTDGEEGYPGKVQVRCMYAWADDVLNIHFTAQTDEPTPVNLTTHPYWNLAGGGDILGHEMTIMAEQYTPMNSAHIPIGKIESVKGTCFDFRTPRAIGSRLSQLKEQPPGYNANYVLVTSPPRKAANIDSRARQRSGKRSRVGIDDQSTGLAILFRHISA
jgi:aldose 1-epimerase